MGATSQGGHAARSQRPAPAARPARPRNAARNNGPPESQPARLAPAESCPPPPPSPPAAKSYRAGASSGSR